MGVVTHGHIAGELEPFQQRQAHRARADHADFFHIHSVEKAGRSGLIQ